MRQDYDSKGNKLMSTATKGLSNTCFGELHIMYVRVAIHPKHTLPMYAINTYNIHVFWYLTHAHSRASNSADYVYVIQVPPSGGWKI